MLIMLDSIEAARVSTASGRTYAGVVVHFGPLNGELIQLASAQVIVRRATIEMNGPAGS